MRKIISTLILLASTFMAHAQLSCATMNLTALSGGTFAFSATPMSGTIIGYSWAFGDGGTSSQPTPTHTYAVTGYYSPCVTVIVMDSGSTYTCVVCDSLYAQGSITSCSSYYNYTAGSGNTVNFTGFGSGPGTITGYSWAFGDGGTSTLTNPSHTYSAAGTYNCCLTVYGVDSNQNAYNCTYCDSVTVGTVMQPCAAYFTYNANGLTASFSNLSSAPGAITSYSWTFGDGGTSTAANPSHTYAASGNYNVCLSITGYDSITQNPFSCTYCDSLVYVSNTTCNANFSYNMAGSTYYFTNTSTTSGTIIGYSWDFGDGGTSTIANPTHTYTTSGPKTVCLIIYVANGGTMTSCAYCNTIYVTVLSGPCNANFTYTQTSGSSFNFTNTSTAGGTITSYSWDFGDGGTSTVANPSHTYAISGNHTVCLTISGIDSNQNTFTCTHCDSSIYSQGGSGCSIVANFTNTSTGNTANFSNSTTCTGCSTMSYSWNFGDAGTATSTNPSHTYAAAGTYNVCLIATGMVNGSVCMDTICHNVIVGSSAVQQIVKDQLQVYPNPSQENFQIQLPDNKVYELKLMDMSGRTISKSQIQSNNKIYTLPGSQLADGLYYLSISGNDKFLHTRIMKQ